MKLKLFLFYIEGYLIEFPLYYLHELSHWLLALVTFLLGINSFPVIKIIRKYKIVINDDNTTSSYSWHMQVSYSCNEDNKWLCPLISCSPAIMTVLLFIYSPYWLYPLYLSKISTLWLSVSDQACVEEYFFNKNNGIGPS